MFFTGSFKSLRLVNVDFGIVGEFTVEEGRINVYNVNLPVKGGSKTSNEMD